MEEYGEAIKNNVVAVRGDKVVVMVGWKPSEENWVKLNIDGACMVGRKSGCGGIKVICMVFVRMLFQNILGNAMPLERNYGEYMKGYPSRSS